MFSRSLRRPVKNFKSILMGKIPHDGHIPIEFQPYIVSRLQFLGCVGYDPEHLLSFLAGVQVGLLFKENKLILCR